ncbi:MAG: lysozyme inhibitor LprI family protein [Chlorobiaceae bacterium]
MIGFTLELQATGNNIQKGSNMKAIVLILLMFCSLSQVSFAQTQSDMNEESSVSYKKVDAKLNNVYHQILKRYGKNPLFIKNLKVAQRIWVQFRDAQLAMKFPERGNGYYGSVLPMCQAIYLKELTERRVAELDVWLVKGEDGDVCNGTIGEYAVEE